MYFLRGPEAPPILAVAAGAPGDNVAWACQIHFVPYALGDKYMIPGTALASGNPAPTEVLELWDGDRALERQFS